MNKTIHLTSNWIDVETEADIQFTVGSKYRLQLREQTNLYYFISDTVPQGNEGIIFSTDKPIIYDCTSESKRLYLKAVPEADIYIEDYEESGGVTPTGTINITENGVYDVTQYASADVNVTSGKTIQAKNSTGYPITSGEFVRFTERWNDSEQTMETVIVNGGFQEVNGTFSSGRATKDIAVNETGTIMYLDANKYYSNVVFNVTPSNANISSNYFNKYEGSSFLTNDSSVLAPYYSTINTRISLDGYKPKSLSIDVVNTDITRTVTLEPSTPILLISIPTTSNYYYCKNMDNVTLTTGTLPNTITYPIVGDGAYLYAGSSAASSNDMFYSNDGENWTTVSDENFTNPKFVLCNKEVYMQSDNIMYFKKVVTPTNYKRIGMKQSNNSILIEGGYDSLEFQYSPTTTEISCGFEASPDNQIPQQYAYYQMISNIVEKWGKGWIADDKGSSASHLLSMTDATLGFNTTVSSANFNNQATKPFIVDCDTHLATFFNKNFEYSNILWLVDEQGTVTKKNYPTGTTNCYGAAYYQGTIYALFKVNNTNCLYKSTDLGDTWTLIENTSITIPSSSFNEKYGNLMTIGYI